MMTVGERIRYLRRAKLDMTQDGLSRELKISRANLGSIETGRVNATERVLSDISEKFNVNLNWLYYGGSDEDIFKKISYDEEVAIYIQDLLDDEDDVIAELIKNFIVTYEKLDDESKNVLRTFGKKFLENSNNCIDFNE